MSETEAPENENRDVVLEMTQNTTAVASSLEIILNNKELNFLVDTLHHFENNCSKDVVCGKSITLIETIGIYDVCQKLIDPHCENRMQERLVSKREYYAALSKKGFIFLMQAPLHEPRDMFKRITEFIKEGAVTDVSCHRLQSYYDVLMRYTELDRCKPGYDALIKDIKHDLVRGDFDTALAHRDALRLFVSTYNERLECSIIGRDELYEKFVRLKTDAIQTILHRAEKAPCDQRKAYCKLAQDVAEFNILVRIADTAVEDPAEKYAWVNQHAMKLSEKPSASKPSSDAPR